MIELTRLNGNSLTVNCDLIKYAEASPDTTLTLITGEKLVVLESCSQVQQLALDYRAETFRRAWPEGIVAFPAKAAFDAADQARKQNA